MKTRKINLIFNFISILAIISMILFSNNLSVTNASFSSDVNHRASILIERTTGQVLFDNNSHSRHPIASVTKLMTVLLTFEKIESGEISIEDKVLVSANANGMGGSQIFLDANTEYPLDQLLKSVIVASANDSSVAIAEHISGSENNFVRIMNEKAKELGMNDTLYSNCTGLPTSNAYSSAYDQAILLNQVLKHELYHNYSSIWMEDFVHPGGRITEMTNTNRLSRFYDGCIGGKTGSTNEAKYCLAIGAERNNLELIAVVLGADNSKDRFNLASNLLSYGFDNYSTQTIFSNKDLQDKFIKIKGIDEVAHLKAEREYSIISKNGETINYSIKYNLPNMMTSTCENQVVGNVEIVVDGIVVDRINILAKETINKARLWDYFKDIINS